MNKFSGSLVALLLLSINVSANSMNLDFNGDGKADILWKKDKYYSLWYMNASGSHKYKYIGKKYAPYEVAGVADFNGDGKADILWKKDKYYSFWYMTSTGKHKYKYIGKKYAPYEVVSVADFNGDGKADILWKKDKYYSFWYMNTSGSHKYKYIGKKYAPYEVLGGNNSFETLMDTYLSKLFFNGNDKTTTISKSMSIGSKIEGVNLGFKPSITMGSGSSFSLKFKNGGFDISEYYPALCVGSKEVGTISSLGDNYDSDNSIIYTPTFQINYDVSSVSKNSLITFHKDNCNNEFQPMTTTSTKDVVIETQIINGLSEQATSIKDYNTNSVRIKVNIKGEVVNSKPTVNAGEDKTVTVNESVTLYGSGTDSEGSVTFKWKKGNSVLGTSATLTYTPTKIK